MTWIRRVLAEKNKWQSKRLGKLLKERRLKMKLTQAEVAAQLGRSQSYMARLEAGERQIAFVEMEELARFLERSPSDFLTLQHVELKWPRLKLPERVWQNNPELIRPKRKIRRR